MTMRKKHTPAAKGSVKSEFKSEALGISSLPRVLDGVHFPISRINLIHQFGLKEIDLPGGRSVPLRDLFSEQGDYDFNSMGEIMKAARERISALKLTGKEVAVGDVYVARRQAHEHGSREGLKPPGRRI